MVSLIIAESLVLWRETGGVVEVAGGGEAAGGREPGSISTLKLQSSRLDCWSSEKGFFDSFTVFLIPLKNVSSW